MSVADYRSQVEALADELLTPYLVRLQSRRRDLRPKVINDPVWQTVSLQAFEVLILDSPLLQRLRAIRQLGVAHWTYPSAHHSRLEHSIGAVHNVQRLLEALKRSNPAAEALFPAQANLLRLAALCHDVGHGFMSHVSENAIDALGVAIDLKLELAAHFDVEECPLAEAASNFILASPAFRRLAALARDKTGHELPFDFEEMLPKLVLGLPINDQFPLIQELISGPFDADKLDYMTRDAEMSGIPVVTDIPRLIHKVRLVEVGPEALPSRIRERVEARRTYFVQGIATSGARTLDELMIGRTLLYDKIYRHQKVRATEAMALGILSALAEDAGNRLAFLPLLLRDHEILHLTAEGLQQKAGIVLRPAHLKAANDLSKRLRDRRLFQAAYAFSHYLPSDPFKDKPEQRVGLERLRSLVQQPEGRQTLAASVRAELVRMRALLPGAIAPDIGDDLLQFYFALDPPSPSSQTSEIAKALLVTTADELVAFRDDVAEAAPWSNAYLLTRDLGFVFCAEELAPAVYLATELVLRRDLAIRTPVSVFEYAKVDRKAVGELREELARAAYYPSGVADLRPEPKRLTRADVAGRLQTISRNLALFQGLTVGGGRLGRAGVSPELLKVWLRQFDTDDWVEGALDLIEATEIIGPELVRPALEALMREVPELATAIVCPLGSPRDSSGVVSYYVGDLAPQYKLEQAELSVALERRNGRPILFVDDFIGSGRQSRTILGQWLDDENAEVLNEEHVDALPGGLRAELRSRILHAVFLAGDPAGAASLEEAGRKLGLKLTATVFRPLAKLPKAFDATYVPANSRSLDPEFRDVCRQIGEELLVSHQGTTRTASWIADRALGFGNEALLIAFPYNTPTQALTLLWGTGRVRGFDWLPLLPRRAKT